MKSSLKLFSTLVIAIASICFASAADLPTTKDCVTMKDGSMMVMKNGQTMPMKDDMTLSNGTKVMKDGSVMMADGTKSMMKDGDMMSMDGKMMSGSK